MGKNTAVPITVALILTLTGCASPTTPPVSEPSTAPSTTPAAELPVHTTHNSGGWGVMTGAATLAGVTRCIVGPAGSAASLANLEMLPHGAWAFDPAQVQSGVWTNHDAVSVAGVTEPAYLLSPVGTVSA
ncbi:hypothetical protein E3T46_07365 [Cryobacterium sp. Hh11]|uniref:hypothetical protein n=1 Tax=Cryobacterium sp. Hh11 TaxID=2555868 RepID=UPI00106D535E|nr:hypothetical protein [Cryobacterium sp. Hh11]TFD52108.1 hypothetical protein E3T46_07365 [Cryobacterium sp. Hh11]